MICELATPEAATWSTVLIILSIGAIVSPVIFGFSLWKMSQIFVTRESFNAFRDRANSERKEIETKLDRLEGHVLELLQRTARWKIDGPGWK